MKLVLAGDSAGKPLIDVIAAHLAGRGDVSFIDASKPADGASEKYADMTERAARLILAGEADRGIRAALTHDTYSADRAAKSNNAQVITMGARVIGAELAKAIVDKFLEASFDPGGASAGNVEAIDRLDERARRAG